MKLSRFINMLVVASMVLAALGLSIIPTAAQAAPNLADEEYVPGELIIAFRDQRVPLNLVSNLKSAVPGSQPRLLKTTGTAALVEFNTATEMTSLAERVARMPGVLYAEPNYILALDTPATTHKLTGEAKFIIRRVQSQEKIVQRQAIRSTSSRATANTPQFSHDVKTTSYTDGKSLVAIPVDMLKGMQVKDAPRAQGVYPNDPYLWWNGGPWTTAGAEIVWPNTTISKNVCVVDTGVDYLHKDLTATYILKGRDFVNDDLDPMDDNGHGTHVAGIITARPNNLIGMVGAAPTAKVVAVKVLNAQGYGTSFNIAQGIRYCADRLDVSVINLSLGSYKNHQVLYDAVAYAVGNTKNKLIVAAAGNDNVSQKFYPAAYSDTVTFPEFTNRVISVAASGQWYQPDPVYDPNWWQVDYWCKAAYSNYGRWVTIVAPGTDVYSTTPWDRAFWLNQYEGVEARYSSMDGTSMAAPFVAAAAARRWGFVPTSFNWQVGDSLSTLAPWTFWDPGDESCMPASLVDKKMVNVGAMLNRGAAYGQVFDSTTGLPLDGAAIQAYKSGVLVGSGTIEPSKWKAGWSEPDSTRIYLGFNSGSDVLNLPADNANYIFKVNKINYTASPQPAFIHSYADFVNAGRYTYLSTAAIPPKSVNFDVSLGWWQWYRNDLATPWVSSSDLDLNIALPTTANPMDVSQPRNFVVGSEGNPFDTLGIGESPEGTMVAFPFAARKRDGGTSDWLKYEDITFSSRKAHGTLVANPALPYYPGDYVAWVTDWGQTVDHDGDGCGDNYGADFLTDYDNTCGGSGTPGIPLMGPYLEPYIYAWKDGLMKYYQPIPVSGYDPGAVCNTHWWKAFKINSLTTGLVTYAPIDDCAATPWWPEYLDMAGDIDGDGLLNGWEINGYDADGDNVIDVDLPALGANYKHKDIFVEMDYMVRNTATNGLAPSPAVLAGIEAVFADAPFHNPDGTFGINIHLESGNEVPWDSDLNNVYTEFYAIKDTNFDVNKTAIYHYMIWADGYGGGSSSGLSFGIPATDFIVTLGKWNSGAGGTDDQKIGTFIHELGHNLALKHGGNDHVNYKPNYLSVMNYRYQVTGVYRDGTWGHFDYQRLDLPWLDENNLTEALGLNSVDVATYGTKYTCPDESVQFVTDASGPIDWNCDGDTLDVGVSADVNLDYGYGWLGTQNNWASIVFDGDGIIGSGLAPEILSANARNNYVDPNLVELTEEMFQQFNP